MKKLYRTPSIYTLKGNIKCISYYNTIEDLVKNIKVFIGKNWYKNKNVNNVFELLNEKNI